MPPSSIHDVAKYCGVSTATVSRAIRGLPNVSPRTRQLVLAGAAELGYVPSPSASGLSGGRHHAVAIVVPSTTRWFSTKVVEGVDSILRREGYDTFLIILAAGLSDRERLFHNSLLRKRADAVIALGIDFTASERKELRSLQMPSVVVGGQVRGVRNIGVDDEAIARAAVDHLLSLGHRSIAHLGGENEYGMSHSVGEARGRAWRNALTSHGIVPEPHWYALGAFLMPQAKVAAAAMLRHHTPPTAVFAASDEMAFGVLTAAADLGVRVPEDLSVVGIDDHDWSESFGLTTLRQDPYSQGRTAAQSVLDELGGLTSPQRWVRSEFELVRRRSTSALRRDAAAQAASPDAAPTTA